MKIKRQNGFMEKSLLSKFLCLTILFMLLSTNLSVVHAAKTKAPDPKDISVANNAGMADVVEITNLSGGEIIKIYDSDTDGRLLAAKTVPSTRYGYSVSIPRLNSDGGKIYVTFTVKGSDESDRTPVTYDAEPRTPALDKSNIFAENNAGTTDNVYVQGLYGGETIRVYSSPNEGEGKLIGTANVSKTKTEAVVKITQLGITGGAIGVTVANKGERESERTPVSFLAEPVSATPDDSNISVTNNVGIADTVQVSGLSVGDRVKVYDYTKIRVIGTATLPSSKTDVTISIPQIGKSGGKIYVTVTSKGMRESPQQDVDFPEETQSAGLDADSVTVTNNSGASDTVYVYGLEEGDAIKVYNQEKGGSLLGTGTVAKTKSDVTITIPQIGSNSGTLYISKTKKGEYESARVGVAFDSEPKSAKIDASNITVTNNAGANDTVYISGLASGDTVKIYNQEKGGKLLQSGTVSGSSTELTMSIPQLGVTGGSIWVSLTNKGSVESDRTQVFFNGESTTDKPSASNIVVTNNAAGTSDTVNVTGLNPGDIVKVYNSATGGILLGKATVPAGGSEATVSIVQTVADGGTLYVSVTGKGKGESERTAVTYGAEEDSDEPADGDITVANNPAGTADTVYVADLTEGDIVKVYDAETGGKLLKSATVAAGATDVAISITQLGSDSGTVYVSITSKGKKESKRIKASYAEELGSGTIDAKDITVTNNVAGTADTVEVVSLDAGDVIKVYSAAKGGTLLGTATVPDYGTYATVSISQLGATGGTIYVSKTGVNKLESGRTAKTYSGETPSQEVSSSAIRVTNNASGTPDTVEVTGLNEGDVVKVYNAAQGGKQLGTATVAAGSTYAVVSINQLGTEGGSVYVSITGVNKLESNRVKADYVGEPETAVLPDGAITVVNNAGSSDTVTVKGLVENSTVRVYDAETGGNLLGTGTVAQSETSVTISITQLGTSGGTVYVSATAKNSRESARKPASYSPEVKTDAPAIGNIKITNNVGTSDTILVSGLSGGEVVKAYETESGGTPIGTATAASGENSVLITVTQLNSDTVYISVTEKNKQESDRTRVACPKEATTAAPDADSITVKNNAGMADTVIVSGLTKNITVKVYDVEAGGEPIGTKTTGDYDTSATISITQLGAAGGDIYVTLTGKNAKESGRAKVHFNAEPVTEFNMSKCTITVDNNAGISDTVTVTGVTKGDVVNVYDEQTGGTLLGTATAGTYDSSVTVTIDQLGGSAGKAYVSLTQKGKQESGRVEAAYNDEPESGEPDTRNIIVTNNAGTSDTVEVNCLAGGDIVKVYSAATGGMPIGTATAGTYDSAVTITISQLGSAGGTIYVSVTSKGKLEGKRTAVPFAAEIQTDPPLASNIEIVNNAGISDTINVTYLKPGDLVKIYSESAGGTLLGQGKVASSDTEVTVSITQLGETEGKVYISVTGTNKLESARTEVAYTEEMTSDKIAPENVSIVNNAKLADTVTVTFLEPNDLVKVYSAQSGGKLLGQSTVADDGTQTTVQISELSKTGGNVYITVTSTGKKESARTEVPYGAEQKTTAPSTSNVTIINNAGMQDTVTAVFLDPGDVVKVYASSTATTPIGSGTVAESGTEVTIKIEQLGAAAGTVYVTVTSTGKLESDRVAVDYIAERTSDRPDAANITVTNNTNKSDTVRVTGLSEGDVVKVYDSSSGGKLLGYGTVGDGYSEVTVKLTLPSTTGGKIYVTVTSTGTVESSRTEKDYGAE